VVSSSTLDLSTSSNNSGALADVSSISVDTIFSESSLVPTSCATTQEQSSEKIGFFFVSFVMLTLN
jgi:hypothetical protein